MDTDNRAVSNVSLAVIGDEVLLGEVRDLNINIVSREVFRLGADLSYACVLPDDPEFMFEHLSWMKERFDWIVTTGGIGATHDDLTKQVICRIVEKDLVIASEAVKALEERIGRPLPEKVVELAMVPEGAELVINARTAAPGFIIENFLVLPGIPSLVEPMIRVLEAKLIGKTFHISEFRTINRESDVARDLEYVQGEYPSVKIGSYPELEPGGFKVRIVLRSRDPEALEEARTILQERIKQ